MTRLHGEASVAEKLGLIPVFMQTVLVSGGSLLTAPFRGPHGTPTLLKHVIYASVRTLMRNTTIAQQQCLSPTTTQAYLNLAKSKKFHPETLVLADGCRAHWIGRRTAKKVILYCHGGGYALPASSAHVGYLWRLYQELGHQGHDVAIIMLAYTTAPLATYPTQLNEAADLLHYLLEEEERHPSDIVLAGDSAGGNLVLAVLSHILHPHPSNSVPRISLSSPLAACLIISPWGCFDTSTPSFKRNYHSDMLVDVAEDRWAQAFLGSAPSDRYTEPALAPKEWWTGLDQLVKDVYFWAGGGEVLLDGIREVAEKIQSVHSSTVLEISPGSGHEEMIFDVLLGYDKSVSTRNMEDWLGARL